MKSVYTQLAYEFSKPSSFWSMTPPSVEIDLTSKCNQDCTYCNSREYRKKTEDDANGGHYMELIRSLYEYNMTNGKKIKTICFTGGGEPTLFHEYEKIIKYAIDKEFLVSLVTNGTNLNRLLNVDVNTLRQLAWVGVDVDAGKEKLYNKIRRPKSKNDYRNVKNSIKDLCSLGVPIDIKVLLMEENSSPDDIDDIFKYAQDVGARGVYFRPVILDGKVFKITDDISENIVNSSELHKVRCIINNTKDVKRNYSRCYATYLLPVFCSDGYVYLCCENRGNPDYALCSWVNGEFRDLWSGLNHKSIFSSIDVSKCKPCRPNVHNNEIAKRIYGSFDELFF